MIRDFPLMANIFIFPEGFDTGDQTEEKHVFQCPHCGIKIPIIIRGKNLEGVTIDFIKAKHN